VQEIPELSLASACCFLGCAVDQYGAPKTLIGNKLAPECAQQRNELGLPPCAGLAENALHVIAQRTKAKAQAFRDGRQAASCCKPPAQFSPNTAAAKSASAAALALSCWIKVLHSARAREVAATGSYAAAARRPSRYSASCSRFRKAGTPEQSAGVEKAGVIARSRSTASRAFWSSPPCA